MEAGVAALLRSLCGSFFADGSISSANVNIEMWSGKAYLRNLALDPGLFHCFGIPLRITSGFVGELCVELPWYGLRSRPVAVSLRGVILEVAPSSITSSRSSSEHDAGNTAGRTGEPEDRNDGSSQNVIMM